MDDQQRASRLLGIGCQFSGWNQTDRHDRRQRLPHVQQFGNELGLEQRAFSQLERGRILSGWNEIGGGGNRLRQTLDFYLDEFGRLLGDE